MIGSCNRGRFRRRAPFSLALVLCWFLLLSTAAVVQTDPREALQNAASLVKQRQLDKAEQQARLALSDPQIRPAAYSVLGTIRFEQKRLAESAKFFQEAVRLEPRLLGANLILVEIEFERDFHDETDEAFRSRHV